MIFNKFKNIKYSDEFVLNGAIFIYTDRYLKENNFQKKIFIILKCVKKGQLILTQSMIFQLLKI